MEHRLGHELEADASTTLRGVERDGAEIVPDTLLGPEGPGHQVLLGETNLWTFLLLHHS